MERVRQVFDSFLQILPSVILLDWELSEQKSVCEGAGFINESSDLLALAPMRVPRVNVHCSPKPEISPEGLHDVDGNAKIHLLLLEMRIGKTTLRIRDIICSVLLHGHFSTSDINSMRDWMPIRKCLVVERAFLLPLKIVQVSIPYLRSLF